MVVIGTNLQLSILILYFMVQRNSDALFLALERYIVVPVTATAEVGCNWAVSSFRLLESEDPINVSPKLNLLISTLVGPLILR